MGTGWKTRIGAAVVLATLGLGACSDDDAEPVTAAEYQDSAEELCEQHGSVILEQTDAVESRPESDAEIASFLVAEFVPRIRVIVRSLANGGFPPSQAAEYSDAANRALVALAEIEDDAFGLLDRLRGDLIREEDDPFVAITAALQDMDIPCA